MSGQARKSITICLGSSCFTRGNAEHLPRLQALLEEKGLGDRVHLKGSRCEGKCLHGPNLRVGDALVHEVKEDDLEGIVERLS